jgi:hypothetical protein
MSARESKGDDDLEIIAYLKDEFKTSTKGREHVQILTIYHRAQV